MEGYQYKDKSEHGEGGVKPITSEMDSGLTVRAIRDMFNQAAAIKDKTIHISCSFLQIYSEKVFDLLNSTNLKKQQPGKEKEGLKIRWSKSD